MALIEDLMKTDLITVAPEDKVRKVAAQMDQNGVGAVLVVEKDGSLSGLFSERDLVGRVVTAGLDPESTPVGSVATPGPVGVAPDTHVRACAELLRERGFRHVPVVQDGKPVGILSARDFLEHVVKGLESFIDQERYKEALDEGQDPYDHIGGGYAR